MILIKGKIATISPKTEIKRRFPKHCFPSLIQRTNMQRHNAHRRLLASLAFVTIGITLTIATFASGQEKSQTKINSWNPAQSDRWVATDNLGRSLPTFDEVGPIRPNKYVACFYFLWNGRHGDAGPYNISKILSEHPEAKDDPDSPYWGKMYEPHHWAESVFGYYVGEDESVLRKHAQMLGDAGVDVICFDVTNQLTYPESYRPLFKVFSEMQKEGNKVPKVAFLCPFWAPDKVVRELWRDCYSQDFYKDVWFYWKGKPLILADPDLIGQKSALSSSNCVPVEVGANEVLTQRFSTEVPFDCVNVILPTWTDANSSVNFSLLNEEGEVLQKSENIHVSDNAPIAFSFPQSYPKGVYSVEIRKADVGRLGWWSKPVEEGSYKKSALKAHPVKNVTWLEALKNGKKQNSVFMMSIGVEDKERSEILDFFTFRPSQPDYFKGPTKPNQWSWLEVYPQHEFYNDQGELEEMGVGVAQNAVEGKLGVLSNPKSYGRSYHNGAEPDPSECDYTGKNFQEQWERALSVDPEIIFVTGWNEWIAGRFDINAPFHGATPVSFVDQFNEEFSRDCEPMKGGHEDAYYYQLISNIRRFKGVSKQTAARTQKITVDGDFTDWSKVEPVFYDTISDQVRRDCRGWGKDMHYVNASGRNDIVEARVSFDDENVFFYVKMKETIKGTPRDSDWLTLLIDIDDNPNSGYKGAEYTVSASVDKSELTLALLTAEGSKDSSREIACKFKGSELELAVPRATLNCEKTAPTFRFKWTDGVDVFGDWAAFTTDGDAAPNDRYFYRYEAP